MRVKSLPKFNLRKTQCFQALLKEYKTMETDKVSIFRIGKQGK